MNELKLAHARLAWERFCFLSFDGGGEEVVDLGFAATAHAN